MLRATHVPAHGLGEELQGTKTSNAFLYVEE